MVSHTKYSQALSNHNDPAYDPQDISDDEGDLGEATLELEPPLRSGQSPFGDTAYTRYSPPPIDAAYLESPRYTRSGSALSGKSSSTWEKLEKYDDVIRYAYDAPRYAQQYVQEHDSEAAFRERQQPLTRGHTRRVKLVNGDIFCTDYP